MKLYRGCDLLLFAEVLQDDQNIYKAEIPEKLGALASVAIPEQRQISTVYKDGSPIASYSTEVAGAAVQISTEGLSVDIVNYLCGLTNDKNTGFYVDTGEQTRRYFALGFRLLFSDGSHRYKWFLKGTFSRAAKTVNTKSGVETVGDILLFCPIFTEKKFDFNGKSARSVAVDEDKINREVTGDYWAATVWTPDNLSQLPDPVILPAAETLYVGDTVSISAGANDIEYEVLE